MAVTLVARVVLTRLTGGLGISATCRDAHWLEEPLEARAMGTQILVCAHVAGAIMTSINGRESLARAMPSGRERA
jgi:hypothetical protein